MQKLCVLFFLFFTSTAVVATTEEGYPTLVQQYVTPVKAGVRPVSNAAYFFIAETWNIPGGCAANVVWIPLTDTTGAHKLAYATVLIALAEGKQLTWVDYYRHSNGNCYVQQVEIS